MEDVKKATIDAVDFINLKNQWLAQVRQSYTAFINAISKIPAMQQPMLIGMQYLETGILWIEKGVQVVPLEAVQNVKPVQASQPTTPAPVGSDQAAQDDAAPQDSNATEEKAA